MAEIKEECGVFGIYDLDGNDVTSSIYYGLTSLQHRGQEACGLGPIGNVKFHKDLGLVSEVLREDTLHKMSGDIGIGHVRYSTTGASVAENAQPLVLSYVKGSLALAHNGNLVNTGTLKWELIQNGAIFHTTTDSEVIAFHIARERVHSKTVEEAVLKTAKKIKGAYALVVTSPRKLIGARDPFGLKPLCIGKRDNTYFLASESCAIAAVGGEFVRDVEPGEIVSFTKHGMKSDKSMAIDPKKQARCIFEYIYFARMDSVIDNVNVYHARIVAGKALAESYPVDADLVVGVPDSGLVAAKGYSEQSGIPYGMAFHKNSYVGRTFIKPKQSQRESSVKIKLNVIEEVVKGKRIVMVDDSIVRGTQLRETTEFLYRNGAKEVHIRPACPPLLYGCKYLNFSRSKSEMDLITRRVIAKREGENVSDKVLADYADPNSTNYKEMLEEIRKELNFTSLKFHRLDDLKASIGISPCKLCTYCWDGKE